jgi:transposase-like protein
MINKTKERKQYTDEFKQDVLKQIQERGDESKSSICKRLGLSPNMVHEWGKKVTISKPTKARVCALPACAPITKPANDNNNELLTLREENAMLRKLLKVAL